MRPSSRLRPLRTSRSNEEGELAVASVVALVQIWAAYMDHSVPGKLPSAAAPVLAVPLDTQGSVANTSVAVPPMVLASLLYTAGVSGQSTPTDPILVRRQKSDPVCNPAASSLC